MLENVDVTHGKPVQPHFIPTYAGLAIVLILANVYLSLLYRASRTANVDRSPVWAPRSLDFAAQDLGGFSYWQLAIASAAGLFLELLVIRWISSEIQVFAYFKNFVLIACFLGFGLGCCLCNRKIRLLAQLLPWLILALIVSLPLQTLRQLLASMPTMIGGLAEVDVSGAPSLPHTGAEWMGILQTITIIVPLFGLIAFSFVPIGQIVGWSLGKFEGNQRIYGQCPKQPRRNRALYRPLFPGHAACRLDRSGGSFVGGGFLALAHRTMGGCRGVRGMRGLDGLRPSRRARVLVALPEADYSPGVRQAARTRLL